MNVLLDYLTALLDYLTALLKRIINLSVSLSDSIVHVVFHYFIILMLGKLRVFCLELGCGIWVHLLL